MLAASDSGTMVTPGIEWIIDAHGCRPDALRSRPTLEALFERIIRELALRAVAPPVWHQFPGPGGITGLVLLSESHLACHTFPETEFAAINLYCCRPRAVWAWDRALAEALGARDVHVRSEPRGVRAPVAP
jgi:S-adenosylmethionine decarboxylase